MRHDLGWALTVALALMLAGCAGGQTRKPSTVENESKQAAAVNLQLGQGYMQRGDYKIAMDKLQHALQLDPTSAATHSVIAVLHERLGQLDKAEEHYRTSIELAPEDGEMLNNYGAHLCRNARYAEADALFKRALADPFYPTAGALLGNAGACAVQAGNLELAESYFRRALKADPKQEQALFQLAQIELRKGNALSARGFIQRYEGVAQTSPELLDMAAQVETALGDKETAAAYSERLRIEYPDYKTSKTPGGANSE